MNRTWTIAAVLSILVLAASSCSGGSGGSGSGRSSVGVDPTQRATARAGNVTVTVPAGAVAGRGRLALSRRGRTPALPTGFAAVGAPVALELSGARLTGTASIRFTGVHAGGDPLVVLWQQADGALGMLPSVTRGATVTARTDRASKGSLARFDARTWAKQHADDLSTLVTGRSNVAAPTCGDEQALRAEQVTVTADPGDAVRWCAGVDGGRSVLRVANDRRVDATVTYPSGWQVLDGGPTGIGLDSLAGDAGWIHRRAATPVGQSARLLGAGEVMTFALPSDPSGRVTVEVDPVAWLVSALRFGVDAAGSIATTADGTSRSRSTTSSTTSVDPASSAWGRMVAESAGAQRPAWTTALTRCLDQDADHATEPDLAVSGSDIAGLAWRCLPTVMSAAGIGAEGAGAGLGAVLGHSLSVLQRRVRTAAFWSGLTSGDPSGHAAFAIRVSTAPGPSTSDDDTAAPPSLTDPTALASFVASVPALRPTGSMAGCESLDLLSIDLASRSAKVFLDVSDDPPCSGDAAETYVEVADGTVRRTLSCPRANATSDTSTTGSSTTLDHSGDCDEFRDTVAMWRGRTVPSVDITTCPSSSGVCVGQLRTNTRE